MKQHRAEKRKIEELIPYVNNPRQHPEKQINQIASSIKEFGFTNPILIDDDNGVVAGHGRLLAALKLDIAEVPVVVLEGLTESQRKAYVIADNKLALNSGWDDELLKLELESLSSVEFDIDLLGWGVLPEFKGDIDYSILDDESVDIELDEMAGDVKKAIQVEFEPHDYKQAQEVIRFWRGKGAYVGGLILDYLRKEMNKL